MIGATSNMNKDSDDMMMKMLQQMNGKLDKLETIQQDVRELKTEKSAISQKLHGLQYEQEEDHAELTRQRTGIRAVSGQGRHFS